MNKAKDRFPNYESICLRCGTTVYKPYRELTDEEIAEIIQHLENAKYVGASKAADMLRQQQAEIELLKAELRLIDELVTGKAQEK